MLTIPATLKTTDAPMKGHFHRRKSKFVFLNNSISLPGRSHPKRFDTGDPKIVPGGRPEGRRPILNAQSLHPAMTGQLVIKDGARDENSRENVCNQADNEGNGE